MDIAALSVWIRLLLIAGLCIWLWHRLASRNRAGFRPDFRALERMTSEDREHSRDYLLRLRQTTGLGDIDDRRQAAPRGPATPPPSRAPPPPASEEPVTETLEPGPAETDPPQQDPLPREETPPPEPPRPRPPPRHPVELALCSTGRAPCEIRVDGRFAARVEGGEEGRILVERGVRLLEFTELGTGGYSRIRLDSGASDRIVIAFDGFRPTRCTNEDGHWPFDVEVMRRPRNRPSSTGASISIRSLDGEWAEILVDGQSTAQMRAERSCTVALAPGVHRIEVREYLADHPYTSCRITATPGLALVLLVSQGQQVRCHPPHPAFRPEF